MYAFEYQKAESVKAAVEALRRRPDAKLVAGGMTLLPTLKLRLAQPSALIDLGAIAELKGIRSAVDPHGTFAANHPVPRLYENGTVTP